MATAYTPIDLTASNYAGKNITDLSSPELEDITAATGFEMDHEDVGIMLVRNTTGGALTFKVTVPVPSDSGLDKIGKTITTDDYTIDANDDHIFANAGAYRDPETSKLTVDASGAGLKFAAFKAVVPEAR